MKLLFAGTPDFAIPTLKTLLNSPHQVCAVYTQPDRPSGRGLRLTVSPVKAYALSQGIPVHQPVDLHDPDTQAQIKAYQPDRFVVVAYGLILPEAVLSIPKFGCLNLHASLLPKWRGASPIVHAILAGDTHTGVSIMQMNKGMDTGPLWKQVIIALKGQETSGELSVKLAELGAQNMIQCLTQRREKPWETPCPQPYEDSCYAPKITKAMARMNWLQPSEQLERCVRAFNPWPVAWTVTTQGVVRIWKAECLSNTAETDLPGKILDCHSEGIDVATGQQGVLRLTHLQRPGGKILTAAEFLQNRQHGLAIGDYLDQTQADLTPIPLLN